MFTNRISSQFEPPLDIHAMLSVANQQPTVVPTVSLQDIYKAAAEQAKRDHELDKLFNAEYYGEDGSGI